MILSSKTNYEKVAFSIQEAAANLGVSKGHLRNENKRGKLRFLKCGRRTLILSSELQRYLSELPEYKTENK